MSRKNDLKAELEAKGIEFDPKAKVAELEKLIESVESVSEPAPVDSVEPSDESPTEPKPSPFIEGKFVENAPVMSANLINGYMEVQTTVARYKMSEEEYESLKDPNK